MLDIFLLHILVENGLQSLCLQYMLTSVAKKDVCNKDTTVNICGILQPRNLHNTVTLFITLFIITAKTL